MKKITLSHCNIAIFLLATIIITFACSGFPVSAAQAEKDTGWIEVRATVPDNFNRSVVVSVENATTLDVYDIELLSINNYVASQQIPAGHYTVSMAFVYQNYTYHVVVDEPEFTVVSDGAAALLNVTVTEGEPVDLNINPSPEIEPSPEQVITEPSVDDTKPTPSPEVPAEDSDRSSTGEIDENHSFSAKSILFSAFGSVLFAGVIFGILYFIRRHFNS